MNIDSFYSIGTLLSEQHILTKDVGLVIINTVVQNRNDNEDAYKSGRQKDFRNKEEARVFRALKSVVDEDHTSPSLEKVCRDHRERLEKYRDIFYINFVYDATKFFYLANPDLEQTASFLGERFMSVFGHPALQQTTWKKRDYDTKTDEYVKYIAVLRSKLQREFSVVFSK